MRDRCRSSVVGVCPLAVDPAKAPSRQSKPVETQDGRDGFNIKTRFPYTRTAALPVYPGRADQGLWGSTMRVRPSMLRTMTGVPAGTDAPAGSVVCLARRASHSSPRISPLPAGGRGGAPLGDCPRLALGAAWDLSRGRR